MAAGNGRHVLAAVIVGLIIVQVGFGGYGIVLQKFAKDAGTDPLVFSICRDGFCAPVLFIVAALVEGLRRPSLRRDLPFFALLGLVGMFGNQYLYIKGLYFTTPNIASIMQPCIPVFTALLALLTCMEPLPGRNRQYQWFKIAGIALATGGAILMILTRPVGTKFSVGVTEFNTTGCSGATTVLDIDAGTCKAGALPFSAAWTAETDAPQIVSYKLNCKVNGTDVTGVKCTSAHCQHCTDITPIPLNACAGSLRLSCSKKKEESKNGLVGVLLLIGNCTSMAIYVLLQKRFVFNAAEKNPSDSNALSAWAKYPIGMTAYSYLFGALCMLIAAGIRYGMHPDSSKFKIPKETYGGLAYAVLVSSALCYGLITWCNKHVSATVVTSFWPLQVFVTIVLSYFVFQDQLAAAEYGGMALIIAGMFAVVYANHLEQQNKKREITPLDYMAENDPLLINSNGRPG